MQGLRCAACGLQAAPTVTPVDERFTRTENKVALKQYEMKTGRRGDLTTVVQLSEEDAKRLGSVVKPLGAKADKPANKRRTSTANKSRRSSANKNAEPVGSENSPAVSGDDITEQ